MKLNSINHILNLLEKIHEKECDVEISLDGTVTFTITNQKINGVKVPEDTELKLSLDNDIEFRDFIDRLPSRV